MANACLIMYDMQAILVRPYTYIIYSHTSILTSIYTTVYDTR